MKCDFARRRLSNPRFSLRSYSKALGISPAHLSLIFSNKRSVRSDTALRISGRLGLTPGEVWRLLGHDSTPVVATNFIKDEQFQLISQWYYYGILGLAGIKPNLAQPQWIARRLGIPVATAGDAFRRLLEHGYIAVERGQFRQSTPRIETQHDVPSAAVRRYHKQSLQIAAGKLDDVEPDLREFVSITLPLNRQKLKAAKNMIRKFKDEFQREFDRGPKTEVYTLAIQLFPLTQVRDK